MSIEMAMHIQLTFAIATVVPAVVFLVLYAREHWWRTWFGISMMLMATAVLGWCATTILYRLFGPGYTGRPWVISGIGVLVFIAMSARTLVLAAAQHEDRKRLLEQTDRKVAP